MFPCIWPDDELNYKKKIIIKKNDATQQCLTKDIYKTSASIWPGEIIYMSWHYQGKEPIQVI